MRKPILLALLVALVLSGCRNFPTPTPTPTIVVPTFTPSPTQGPTNTPTATPVTSTPTPTVTPVGGVSSNSPFCGDAQVSALLASLKTAFINYDGPLFSSLVSPVHGMDVRYWRQELKRSRFVKYDQYHAKFLFVTTWKVDWGNAPGSGRPTIGAFHDIIVPPLRLVLGDPSTINVCNQIKLGGATYTPGWPYYGVNFYSIHYPGTQQNGNLDWQTWLVAMEYVQNKPYLYALLHLNWEP